MKMMSITICRRSFSEALGRGKGINGSWKWEYMPHARVGDGGEETDQGSFEGHEA